MISTSIAKAKVLSAAKPVAAVKTIAMAHPFLVIIAGLSVKVGVGYLGYKLLKNRTSAMFNKLLRTSRNPKG